MSVRVLFKNGRSILRSLCKRNLNTSIIFEKINAPKHLPTSTTSTPKFPVPKNFVLRNVGAQIGLQARRILIDNVLNRVTNSLAADLRKRAARRFVSPVISLNYIIKLLQDTLWRLWSVFCIGWRKFGIWHWYFNKGRRVGGCLLGD